MSLEKAGICQSGDVSCVAYYGCDEYTVIWTVLSSCMGATVDATGGC
jgi:hypothetical protein